MIIPKNAVQNEGSVSSGKEGSVCPEYPASAQNAPDFKVFTPAKSGNRTADKLLESLIGEGVVLKNYSITKSSGEEAFGFFEDNWWYYFSIK